MACRSARKFALALWDFLSLLMAIVISMLLNLRVNHETIHQLGCSYEEYNFFKEFLFPQLY
jgi:hypothetical protein